ncbi:hypothetical protein, partial [Tenacibaculum finnmarkense]
DFKQPFVILINKSHIVFYATILEKNMNAQVDKRRSVLKVEKKNDEDVVIESICKYFRSFSPYCCDLNKGIKFLWNNDVIDSKYASWKKSKSTTTETMDEDYTLKSQYPDAFKDLMNSPLKKTVFKYLLKDEDFPDHFTIEPSVGKISFPLYPKNEKQSKNVVTKIISNN